MNREDRLRTGYTTGTCAAAAAQAAIQMLFSDETIDKVNITVPRGDKLVLDITDIMRDEKCVTCAVRKDAGDDPDITDGVLIYAKVFLAEKGILIKGGKGVGVVTKPGLDQPVGEWAINRVPRAMIKKEIESVCAAYGYAGGITVEISIPAGDELAGKTFNPKLGIKGGLSVLGTSGIVVPMSEPAIIDTIKAEISVKSAQNKKYFMISPGNYGKEFVKEKLRMDLEQAVTCSNYVGEVIDAAADAGTKGILFVSHIGKFIKAAGGMMNTHSKNGDARMEILAAHALLGGVPAEKVKEILKSVTTEEGIKIIEECGKLDAVMPGIIKKILEYIRKRAEGRLKIEVILFSGSAGELGRSEGADKMLEIIHREKGEKH